MIFKRKILSAATIITTCANGVWAQNQTSWAERAKPRISLVGYIVDIRDDRSLDLIGKAGEPILSQKIIGDSSYLFYSKNNFYILDQKGIRCAKKIMGESSARPTMVAVRGTVDERYSRTARSLSGSNLLVVKKMLVESMSNVSVQNESLP